MTRRVYHYRAFLLDQADQPIEGIEEEFLTAAKTPAGILQHALRRAAACLIADPAAALPVRLDLEYIRPGAMPPRP